MAVVEELLRAEENGALSFGDYSLDEKKKLSDFVQGGDVYKVKTCRDITRLERNDMVVFESVPGTAVHDLQITDTGMRFSVEGAQDAQITLSVEEDAVYEILLGGESIGEMTSSMGGKLSFGVELEAGVPLPAEVTRKDA